MHVLILNRQDIREYDQLITVLSPLSGKQTLMARGVKKSTSKNAANLEPATLVELGMAHGKGFDYVTSVQPLESFAHVRSDLAKSFAVQYVLRTVHRLLEEGEGDAALYRLLLSWLRFIDQSATFRWLYVDAFLLQFFAVLGFQPVLSQCVICARAARDILRESIAHENPTHKAGFYFAGGGLLCQTCRKKKQQSDMAVISTTLTAVSDLEILLNADWPILSDAPIDEPAYRALHRLLYEFMVYHSERRLQDWEQLARLTI